MVFLSKGNVALSVTMTALSTLLAALMTPTLTELLAGSRVDVSAGGLLLSTLQVVILPVVSGALIKWQFPRAIEVVLPIAPLVAMVAITLIVASIIGAGRAQILEAWPRLVLAVFSLHVFGFLVGYAAGKGLLGSEIAARIDRGRNVELGARSGAGATALREPAGGNSERDLQRVFHSLVGSLVAAWWRRSASE